MPRCNPLDCGLYGHIMIFAIIFLLKGGNISLLTHFIYSLVVIVLKNLITSCRERPACRSVKGSFPKRNGNEPLKLHFGKVCFEVIKLFTELFGKLVAKLLVMLFDFLGFLGPNILINRKDTL